MASRKLDARMEPSNYPPVQEVRVTFLTSADTTEPLIELARARGAKAAGQKLFSKTSVVLCEPTLERQLDLAHPRGSAVVTVYSRAGAGVPRKSLLIVRRFF